PRVCRQPRPGDEQHAACLCEQDRGGIEQVAAEPEVGRRLRRTARCWHAAPSYQCAAGFADTRAFHTLIDSTRPITASGIIAIGHAYQFEMSCAAGFGTSLSSTRTLFSGRTCP